MDLALKYRPKSWQDVIGQETIVSILSRQIATKAWKNAYLFCGAHGCGKTTCARILANEINGGDGQPIEIDGASNNGVDNIRQLIADAQQSSIDSEYKVYIIDEAHMITTQGWNAALKLIEEPPLNSVFIFCTTNPEKIPMTIMSRVQRFDFRRVPRNIIADRLEFIMNEETHTEYDRGALERISSKADGHVRDAIRLLDKCLGVSDKVTTDVVEATLGTVKYESVMNIMSAMQEGDMEKSLVELNNMKSTSADMLQVYDTLMEASIDCAIYSKIGKLSLTNIPSEYESKVKRDPKYGKMVERFVLLRRNANVSNAEALLRTIIIEMCG